MIMSDIRTNAWLRNALDMIWQTYFPDIPRANDVMISFGRRASTRLGSIRMRGSRSSITITGLFRDVRIPDVVIFETIAHELIHYAHGFESPLPRRYSYPHEGGIIHKEMRVRGLAKTHLEARRWLRANWRTWNKQKIS